MMTARLAHPTKSHQVRGQHSFRSPLPLRHLTILLRALILRLNLLRPIRLHNRSPHLPLPHRMNRDFLAVR